MSSNSDYPFYKKITTINRDKFIGMVKRFKYTAQRHYDGEYNKKILYILENWIDNEQLNNITDLFTEECRILCNFKGYISPNEYWNKNKSNMLKRTKDIRKLREMLYSQTKLCNNFRITVAISILRLYKAKSWLDISAGWGDRLIAAIACDVRYFSTDPNICLFEKYNNIIDTLALPNKKDQYTIMNNGFEYLHLPINERFDLCFTSPPFYDLEDYSTSSEDSITSYKSEQEWYKKFLLYSIKKAINALAVNGHLVIYITESKGTNYINKMLEDVNKMMKYKGILYYYYPENRIPKLRGSYVWKKKYDENPNFYLKKYKNVDIIQDDLLEGGTRQRALIGIIKSLDSFNEFAIFIEKNINDAITLAYCCYVLKKTAHIFALDVDVYLRTKIESLGGIIHEGSKEDFLKFKDSKNIYEFTSGFRSELFDKTLEKKIKFALGTTFVKEWHNKYDDVWVIADLSTIFNRIFPASSIIKIEDTYLTDEDILNRISLDPNNKSKRILFWISNKR